MESLVMLQNNHNSELSPNNFADFNKTIDGSSVYLFTLYNKNGMKALITNLDGRIVSLYVPDNNGKLIDVVEGFEAAEGYQISTDRYYGAIIGCFYDQSTKQEFQDSGYSSTLNNHNPNMLLKDDKRFQYIVWDAIQPNNTTLELSYLLSEIKYDFSKDMRIKVVYTLMNNNALKITYHAVPQKKYTLVNLTNRVMFNLNGAGSGSIINHRIRIKSDAYIPIDFNGFSTDKIVSVDGSPFDFRKGTAIGIRIYDHSEQLKYAKGYDHSFVLQTHHIITSVANIIAEKSGIKLEILTDQPELQLYSGNFMKGENTMKGGHKDHYRTAFAVQTQRLHISTSTSPCLSIKRESGQVYHTETIYRFTN
jgi:aldose 1-epimerase